jgi:hypothetical protein
MSHRFETYRGTDVVNNFDVEERFLIWPQFRLYSLQSFAVPVELRKAAAMFRKILTAELPPFHGGVSIRNSSFAQRPDAHCTVVCVSLLEADLRNKQQQQSSTT